MTPQECLVQICKLKNEKVYNLTEVALFYESDYQDLLNNSKVTSKKIIYKMRKYIYEHINQNINQNSIFKLDDTMTCPWCLLHDPLNCFNCFYNKIHGQCNNYISNYQRARTQLTMQHNIDKISDIPNLLENILDIINNFFNQNSLKQDIKKEKLMKVYHIDDSNFKRGIKNNEGVYNITKYNGNIVTNKANRTEKEYALKFETKGRWASNLSKEDFQWFRNKCENVYIKSINTVEFRTIINQLHKMNDKQLIRLQDCLKCHINNQNNCPNCNSYYNF